MARMGPTPKPTSLRILEGNLSRKPINTQEPKPKPLALNTVPPESLDEAAKQIWRDVVPHLVACGLITHIDTKMFARYCDTYARWQAARDFVREKGETYVIKDEQGKFKYMATWPAASKLDKLSQQLLRFEQEFGCTPASRSRIQVDLVQQANGPARSPFDYDEAEEA